MISAHDPMIIGNSKTVAVSFQNGRKIVSLSLDNSLGRMESLARSSILLLVDNQDVTAHVFEEHASGTTVRASLVNFERAMNWLRRTNWGFCCG